MKRGLFTTLIIALVLAEFGLSHLTAPAKTGSADFDDVTEKTISVEQEGHVIEDPRVTSPSLIAPPSPDVRADVRDRFAIDTRGRNPDEVMEKMIPRPSEKNYGPPPGYETDRPELSGDIAAGVNQLDHSVRKIPGYTMKMIGEVEKHGIAALAYTDPEMKRAGNQIGQEVGSGIAHLMRALGKDMVSTARESLGGAHK